MNFKGWGAGITRAASPGRQAMSSQGSNSSSSSLVPSEGHPKRSRDKLHPHMVGGHRGNRSVQSFTSGSGSDVEPPLPTSPVGPNLGKLIRAPLARHGQGGLVFGRDLASATRDTRVSTAAPFEGYHNNQRNLEDRMVPAFVLRCVMHLHKWGLEEEGIFRYESP